MVLLSVTLMLRQSEAVYSNVLATPVTALEPCVLALAFPMGHSSDVERGGGGRYAAWVTACPPYLLTQALRPGV